MLLCPAQVPLESLLDLLRTYIIGCRTGRETLPLVSRPSRAVLRSTAFRLATSRSPRPVQRLLSFVQARWPLTLPCNSNPTRVRVTRSSSGSLRVSGTMWHDSLLSLRCRSMSLAREAASSSSSAHDMREEAAPTAVVFRSPTKTHRLVTELPNCLHHNCFKSTRNRTAFDTVSRI